MFPESFLLSKCQDPSKAEMGNQGPCPPADLHHTKRKNRGADNHLYTTLRGPYCALYEVSGERKRRTLSEAIRVYFREEVPFNFYLEVYLGVWWKDKGGEVHFRNKEHSV